jgi:glycerol-3-phosphate acyltransferase PlsY
MLELGVKTLLAYLLGSVVGALLLGALRGVDIRTQGSGNAGGTNALRTQGRLFALGVVLVDVSKGWVAARLIPSLTWPAPDPTVDRSWLVVSCAGAVVVGHVYPIWHEFRGGKGAATLVGVIAGIAPAALLPLAAVWLLVVALTGFVGLSTICAAVSLPLLLALAAQRGWPALAGATDTTYVAFASLMAAFMAFTHRANLRRMLSGTEHRARSLWLFKNRMGRP